MAGFNQVFDPKNLVRAYKWIMSNPQPYYKGHFRNAYADYALSSDANLKFLRRQISQERYSPTQASKLYLPKPSGLLRPISLLTVDDQITYQAIANIIAEAVYKRSHKRYRSQVYQHLYAGRSSRFFYLKWQDSYRAFANRLKSNFNSGYIYAASFDLTAFYDTIDHHVLRTFLKELKIDPDTVDFLLRCLREWTCSTWSDGRHPIYHEHGIPQGPLSSGIISEVILRHLDDAGTRQASAVRYLRYVDDIKLMSKSEDSLRRRLVTLDLAAKEVGLFPQTSKISIRKISNPTDEFKSVSQPEEPSIRKGSNQAAVQARVRTLGNRGNPSDVTRFKYVLASLDPTAKTNKLLLTILRRQPHLAAALTRHWARYKKLPRKLTEELTSILLESEIYHDVNASILQLMFSRIDNLSNESISTYAYERLFARKFRTRSTARPQPSFRSALVRWAMLSGRMTYADFEALLLGERDWWVRQEIVRYLDTNKFGAPGYAALLNSSMRVEGAPDFSRAASALLFQAGMPLIYPHNDCAVSAQILLRSTKVIPKASRVPSLIGPIVAYILNIPKTQYDWTRFFGADHRAAEQIAIKSKQRFETDIDACAVLFDSFCDAVMRKIYEKRGASMSASYGNVIGAGAPPWLRALPRLKYGFYVAHQLRVSSYTAHPVHTKTGLANARIKHFHFYKIRKPLAEAFQELEASIVP